MENKLTLCVMTSDTKVFRKGQKVWATYITGALAMKACGRYKGRGRWVNAWVHWQDKNKPEGRSFFCRADCRWVGLIEVTEKFSRFIHKVTFGYFG